MPLHLNGEIYLKYYHLLIVISLYAQELVMFLVHGTFRSGPHTKLPSEPEGRNVLKGQ